MGEKRAYKARKPGGGRKKLKPEYDAGKNLKEQMDAAVALYNSEMPLQAIGEELGLNPIKVRKLLITAGVYESDVAEKVQDTFEDYRETQDYKTSIGNLSSIHLAFRHLIDFLAVQHQVGCKSVWLIKTDLLVCNRQRLIQRVQVHKNLMLQIMPQSVPADHLLCLRIKMTVDKNQWLIKVE